MGYATVHSCTLLGLQALPVTVEVSTSGGLPATTVVGLPQSAVRESRDRVRAAIQHAGFTYPQIKVVINLAPADLPKHGGRFDLPIALGILIATGQLPETAAAGLVVTGELGLTGLLRPVQGALPMARAYSRSTSRSLMMPEANLQEASRSRRTRIVPVATLTQACHLFRQPASLATSIRCGADLYPQVSTAMAPGTVASPGAATETDNVPDLADVIGQHQARRAVEIAASGGHNLLMSGAPGTGKSMLASRLNGIQPPMTERECMEVASIASISHAGFDEMNWGIRPFRAPHHTASGVALSGGGAIPMPGEISLAHNGVLFLDELPEFSRAVLEGLRQPLENGRITISRAMRQADFPARFQLVAAMNPCPCGYLGDSLKHCDCTPDRIERYQSRLSGPFLDRIDLCVSLQREPVSLSANTSDPSAENSATVRQRVIAARRRQLLRQRCCNAQLSPMAVRSGVPLGRAERCLMQQASDRLGLSLRAQHRTLRVALTIADLSTSDRITAEHLTEALGYRWQGGGAVD